VRFGRRVPADDIEGMYRASRGEGFGDEVKRRILLGTYALAAGYYDAYYASAQRARARIASDFRAVFLDGVDLLLTPTTPEPAFPLGARTADPLTMYLSDVYTVTANLAGLPAMSLPAGTSEGLPVGAQLIAPWWHEAEMVRVARVVEASRGGTP
jgi:aspartyl-tRNA(Asn)/glutamyl-tRNA(Gln) amidotransferase subunit A